VRVCFRRGKPGARRSVLQARVWAVRRARLRQCAVGAATLGVCDWGAVLRQQDR
jgi:hypothetical protein